MCSARCLKLSARHRRRVQTTSMLKRSIEESRRHTRAMGSAPSQEAGLHQVRAVMLDVSLRWRGIRIFPADQEELAAQRAEVCTLARQGPLVPISGLIQQIAIRTARFSSPGGERANLG